MKVKMCVLAVVALVIWGMKRHYADARADDLSWILRPTAQVVSVITGTSFVAVPFEGYVSHERLFVIEKSCAGINFLIAAFAMVVLTVFHRVGSGVSAICVLGASVMAGYVAAVLVNAMRITVAMLLADHGIGSSTFSAAQVHRFEGIAVYFAGLVLLYEVVRRVERSAATVRSSR